MKVVVGLRNPEAVYAGTRHNLGAEVVDLLADRSGASLSRGPLRLRCDIAQTRIGETAVLLAMPRVAMNLSGPPIRSVIDYYKVAPDDLLVVHDDIDLPYARLRLHSGRGPGGHNGVRSTIEALGTRDFWRLKMGIGRPPGRMDPAAFVLRTFAKAERAEMDLLVQDAADVVEAFVDDPEAAVQLAGTRQAPL